MQQHNLRSFNEYAKSLRLKYKRIYCTHQKVHCTTPKPTITANIYRPMKFLPPPVIESPQQRYSGIGSLEKYMDDTKELVANNLPSVCESSNNNLNPQQYSALISLKRKIILSLTYALTSIHTCKDVVCTEFVSNQVYEISSSLSLSSHNFYKYNTNLQHTVQPSRIPQDCPAKLTSVPRSCNQALMSRIFLWRSL